jgi:hypothetical protein
LGAVTIADGMHSPDPETIQSLAVGFTRMMFAHAGLESEVRLLQDAVANEPGYSEIPQKQFRNANKRPAEMARLIRQKLGEIAESDEIVLCLRAAIQLCCERNRLAYGEWWRFITVRTGERAEGEPLHKDYREADILRLTDKFEDIAIELCKLRRAVQKYHAPPSLE